ncbi:histidine--tRNA ligase [Flavobacteriaceae bacterium]|nr:histidine--tRNA ligase [Flavobacteriaceae bacterium]MDA9250619.1 histidine--tRNA ligase [Flavobacteriaceae bacterium]
MSSKKPSIPKGTRDFSPKELVKRNYLKQHLIAAFENYGFQTIETPSLERSETLMGKYGQEGDRLIFKILNSGDKVKSADLKAFEEGNLSQFSNSLSEKALRYDLTVPFARYVAQHQNEIQFPFRRYQIQTVWRADRPQHGRFQEFLQCDADVVGERSIWQEIEAILLYDQVFSDLNLDGVTIHLNHRKLLAGIAKLIGVESKLIEFTVALDKLDKIGQQGVIDELIAKGFSSDAIDRLNPILELDGSFDSQLKTITQILNEIDVAQDGLEELSFINEYFKANTLKKVKVDLDVTLARGLNYYTGLILEVASPTAVKMGSIGGGGRYDNLTDLFGLKNTSGFGISFGFDRIYLVLEELNLFPKTLANQPRFLFLNFGEETAACSFEYLMKLRGEGIVSEFYPTASKLKKQFIYANQRSIPFVIMIGSAEFKNKEFILKEMDTGAQFQYPLKELIQKIKEML